MNAGNHEFLVRVAHTIVSIARRFPRILVQAIAGHFHHGVAPQR
jgi:hypothetical protein